MKELSFFNDLIPNIVDEIMMYFSKKEGETIDDCRERTLETMVSKFQEDQAIDVTPHYKELATLCDLLCKVAPLVCFYQDSYFGYRNCYFWNGEFKNGKSYPKMKFEERKPYFIKWENAAFGSRYVYRRYKEFVFPIVRTENDGKVGIGTGFLIGDCIIATARHCIEGAMSISIGGISWEKYKNAEVFFHENPAVDLAFIAIDAVEGFGLRPSEKCEVFDKVITMGYPKIPGFTCFQTAEEAVISAIPEDRFVVTEGQIAAEAQQIWSRENLFLITAKIKGGNSGGPVIDQYGNCIGIVSEIPFSQGDYDDLGYGTVVPAHFIIEMLTNLSLHQRTEEISFVEYPN